MESQELVTTSPAPLVRATGDSMLDLIAAAAVDPRVDPEKLSALLTLKERIDDRQAKINFNHAFARLMLRMPRVKKNGTIDLGKGKPMPFAKWEDVDAVIRPLLAEEGFSLSFTCEPCPGAVQMIGHLRHIDGHEETSGMQLPPDKGPGRNDLQAIGSSHSYGKRYIGFDMLNIITEGKDDDGRATGFISDEQAMQIETLISDCGMKNDKTAMKLFLEFAGSDSVRTIQKHDFSRCMEALRKKLRGARS